MSPSPFPEAALGPVPHLYPFIVNDPGEGTQAKRRTEAVIIDHLTPPLTRAESYGRLAELERLGALTQAEARALLLERGEEQARHELARRKIDPHQPIRG